MTGTLLGARDRALNKRQGYLQEEASRISLIKVFYGKSVTALSV